MKPEQRREWEDGIEHMSDEPWYDSARHNYSKFVQMAQHVERVLGEHNCQFEPFDLWHQIGALYTNPDTGKRHATRRVIDQDMIANHGVVVGMIAELQEKTNG